MQFIHELPGRTHVAVVWKVEVEDAVDDDRGDG